MLNLVIMLLSTMNGETLHSNNYRIAKYMLQHIHELENVTISELAKKCYVSNSSISRFCRDIGLNDYNDLRLQVAKYHVVQRQVKEKFEYETYNPKNVVGGFIDGVINNLYALKSSLHEQAIQRLIEDIYKYENVAAFGYLQSQNVAYDLQFDLQTSGKTISSFIKYAEQIDYMKEADENHLIIIFSQSGSYFKRLERKNPFQHKLHKRKPKIYLITANQGIDLPYVDSYIRYASATDYTSTPYPLQIIAGLICHGYANYQSKQDDGIHIGVY